MTDLNQASSLGEASNPSSGSIGSEVSGESQIGQPAASVSYDTHKKLLSEKKKLQERLEHLESNWKSKEEAELKSQNQYKTLYDNALKEKETLSSKLTEQEQRWNNAIKLDSFMTAMGSRKIDPKYASFINLGTIALDTETGSVDALSVQKEVDRICREYPEIIIKSAVQPKNLPVESPKNPYSQGIDSLKSLSTKERIRLAAEMLSKQK